MTLVSATDSLVSDQIIGRAEALFADGALVGTTRSPPVRMVPGAVCLKAGSNGL